jgi:hypothetical protein
MTDKAFQIAMIIGMFSFLLLFALPDLTGGDIAATCEANGYVLQSIGE